MALLDFTFKILMLIGCWPPKSWTTPHKRLVYNVYTIVLLLLLYSFMLSQLIDLILTVENAEEFTEHFYILIAMIVSCCKLYILLKNRGNIEMLINMLTKKPCKPIQSDEIEIEQKLDRFVQITTRYYAILIATTCLCAVVTSLLTEFTQGRLTYKAWFPFDYSYSSTVFCIVYTYQLISLTIGGFLHVACDGLVCGLLMHICSQIKILECRFKTIARNPGFLRECVIQHNHVFKYARLVNETFKLIIITQFIVSTSVVCFNLYQFTKSTAMQSQLMQLIMYMGCTLSQIFYYCWYGNEVKLQSQDLVHHLCEMEWFELDESTKRSLLIIMKRGSIPIEFNNACVISLDLESFLLKTSYSAYNLLKQV